MLYEAHIAGVEEEGAVRGLFDFEGGIVVC